MSLSARIRADVEGRIRSGEWRPGHRIPFEHELVSEYGCARATVSKALEGLARAGVIERRRRAGSFVAAQPLHSAVLDVPDLAALVAARGETSRWQRSAAPRVVDDAPQLAGRVLLVTGVHHAGAQPLACEHRLIALDAVPEAEVEPFAAVAPGTWLSAHIPWTDARHRIAAVTATAAERRTLATTAACLQLERWTWREDVPVTYARQLFPGDRFDLVAEFCPTASPQRAPSTQRKLGSHAA